MSNFETVCGHEHRHKHRHGNEFVLIIVLFILLIIVGAVICCGGYDGYGHGGYGCY